MRLYILHAWPTELWTGRVAEHPFLLPLWAFQRLSIPIQRNTAASIACSMRSILMEKASAHGLGPGTRHPPKTASVSHMGARVD